MTASVVPDGTASAFRHIPSDESLGYFQDVPDGTQTFPNTLLSDRRVNHDAENTFS